MRPSGDGLSTNGLAVPLDELVLINDVRLSSRYESEAEKTALLTDDTLCADRADCELLAVSALR